MSRKLHIHNRKSYPPRTYCGLSAALVATNAWELRSGETCERCARSQEAERARRVERAALDVRDALVGPEAK